MRFVTYREDGEQGLAVWHEGAYHGFLDTFDDYPGDLIALLAAGGNSLDAAAAELKRGREIDLAAVELLPPILDPPKIICVGLNYVDHSMESGFEPPTYPAVFARFASSLIGHGADMIVPRASQDLDFEGELAAIVGVTGRNISKGDALRHVSGYSIFNDGSIRDYQHKTSQWTIGKNFDGTGAFGPEFVTADELPPGAKGLRLETRLNGNVVQSASTDQMIFSVADLVSILSQAMTLEPGDVIVTGTPAGVGAARKPPLYMKDGDSCEVEIQQVGILRNPIRRYREVRGREPAVT
ncbi:MAG TPA: fumarylacetoacetate hydrolase family protein [Steroidobacteraceae bacterium]|nr:fumarylacetoacetate hydrolase family protein [Steroidobacteraceae bacterium]